MSKPTMPRRELHEGPSPPGSMRVQVAVGAEPRTVDVSTLVLPVGACVRDALQAAGLLASDAAELPAPWSVGVWMRKATLDQALRQDDRVELCRPLLVDPKEARRARYRGHQEKRAASLAAKQRRAAR